MGTLEQSVENAALPEILEPQTEGVILAEIKDDTTEIKEMLNNLVNPPLQDPGEYVPPELDPVVEPEKPKRPKTSAPFFY